MVQVQFYLFDLANSLALEGLEVLLDGVPKITDAYGMATFDNISQGTHSYEILISDYTLDHGLDPWNNPLGLSGSFTIEWILDPSQPWPEDVAWINEFYFMPGAAPQPPAVGSLLPVIAFAGLLLLSKKKG